MMTLLAVCHIIFALLLICLVLLQDPKNAGAGGMLGGGGSNSLLGSTGGATFLTRLTRYSAMAFGITCLVMTIMSRPNVGSVLDADVNAAPVNNTAAPVPAEQQNAPAAPAAPAAAEVPPPQKN